MGAMGQSFKVCVFTDNGKNSLNKFGYLALDCHGLKGVKFIMNGFTCRLIVSVFLVFVSVEAMAARGFFIRNAEVVSVSSFYDGTHNVMQLHFRASPNDVDQVKLTCAPTWIQNETTENDIKVLTWWNSSSPPNSEVQLYYSTALAAQAQNKRVDLYVYTGNCSSLSGAGYGHSWSGTRLSKP